MDIETNLVEQLNAMSAYLRRVASNKDPVSKEMWQLELVEGMIEHADFLDRYTTPKVARLLNGEKLTLRAPVQPKVAELVTAPTRDDLEIKPDDDSSATLVPPERPASANVDTGRFLRESSR